MTKLDFILECNALMINPSVALENGLIREALARGYDDDVKQLLASQF